MIKGSKEIPPRYRRGQMEWALWRQFSHLGDQCRTPAPPVFLNRIKRMLDLDRAQNADVFSYGGSAKGRFVDYAEYSVFLMALALILLDAGFKQGDVLFLLRHMKGQLEEPYLRIMDTPPAPRMMLFHKDRPKAPRHPHHEVMADCSVFLLIRKVEMIECWRWDRPNDPFILGPIFCYGLEELTKELDRLNYENPSKMVIELADLAVMLNGHLKNAPYQPRGRKRK